MIKPVYCQVVLVIAALFEVACSAQEKNAPTDQLIAGPFTITSEWQIITFGKPLKTIPHVQSLQILLPQNEYERVNLDIKGLRYGEMSGRFKRISDNAVIQLEVVLMTSDGYEYKLLLDSLGWRDIENAGYKFLGYNTDTVAGKFYYPKGVEFISMKIRSNIDVDISHLSWSASNYYQAPNDTWDNIKPSKIITFE